MNPTDHHLETLFRDSSSHLSPDVTGLVAGGIARGRARRRRQGVGAALATVAVFGVIGVAASVAPGLGEGGDSAPTAATASDAVKPAEKPDVTQPREDIDAELAIAAEQIPGEIASMLATDLPDALGSLGPVLEDDTFPLVDTARQKTVHFLWDGTLTTFIIEPASTLGSCHEFAGQGDGVCEVVDGLEVLTWPNRTLEELRVALESGEVAAQGVMVWQHGYVVSAISYNAPEGKDVPPVMDAPPISIEHLTEIARSEVWFE
jgi:hypothetical protein